MVLSETRSGFTLCLTLLLVIRGGLWLGECLDVTAVGRNVLAETLPRTFVPINLDLEVGSMKAIVKGGFLLC